MYLHFIGFFSTRVNLRNRSTTFTLGNRDSVITTDLESPIIVVPHAQKSEKKVSILNGGTNAIQKQLLYPSKWLQVNHGILKLHVILKNHLQWHFKSERFITMHALRSVEQ